MNVIIETERLIIWPLSPSDYEAAFKWCGDPEVNRYLSYPLYKNALDVKKWLEGRNINDPNNYDLGFVLKSTNELIGSGGIVYKEEPDEWVIGYNLRKDMWGQGIIVEAMTAIINYVSSVRKINTLTGVCAKENVRSRRVLEKLGLTYCNDVKYNKADGSQVFDAICLKKQFNHEY